MGKWSVPECWRFSCVQYLLKQYASDEIFLHLVDEEYAIPVRSTAKCRPRLPDICDNCFYFHQHFLHGCCIPSNDIHGFFGVPKDTTDVALRPEAKDADNGQYFIEGLAGKEIDSSTV